MIFVIIGGASGSGKTGLSQHVLKKLIDSGMTAQILNMDDYYHEIPQGVDIQEFRRNTNFDTPNMLHLDLLLNHLVQLEQGQSISKPIVSFITNKREGEEVVNPSDVIIMEGIFAQYFYKNFWSSNLKAVTVNVAAHSYQDIVERRIKRDIEHRGRVRDESLYQERKYVGPGFLKFTASSSTRADVYVLNEYKETKDAQKHLFDASANEVVRAIHQKQAAQDDNQTDVISATRTSQLVAESHMMAGRLFHHPRKFEGYFSGVFGGYNGLYTQEFSDEENKNESSNAL